MTSSRTESYIAELRREFPRLHLVEKQKDRFSRLIEEILRCLTFGRQREYSTRYVTTIGQTIYVPDNWNSRSDEDRYITLRHEAVHLRQFRRFSLIGMSLIYLVPILPMGLAIGRALLEREAYKETLRATAEVYGIEALNNSMLRDYVTRQFTSGAYGWMWPFPRTVRKWFDKAIKEIVERNFQVERSSGGANS